MTPVPTSIAEGLPASLKPKSIDEHVIYKRDRYLVKTSAGWEGYLAKAEVIPRKEDKERSYLKFIKAPPVYMEGFFAFRSKFYPVTIRDLVRGQINVRKSRALTAQQLQGIFDPVPEPVAEPAEQPGPVTPTREVGPDTDLASNEYIRTLLFLEDPEEEWDFS